MLYRQIAADGPDKFVGCEDLDLVADVVRVENSLLQGNWVSCLLVADDWGDDFCKCSERLVSCVDWCTGTKLRLSQCCPSGERRRLSILLVVRSPSVVNVTAEPDFYTIRAGVAACWWSLNLATFSLEGMGNSLQLHFLV